MLLGPPLHRVPLLVTLLAALTLFAALCGAWATPFDPDITAARDPVRGLVVTTVALNGPAQAAAVRPGDRLLGAVGDGAARRWLFRTPRGACLTLAAPPVTALDLLLIALGGSLLVLGALALACGSERPIAAAFWRLSVLLGGVLTLLPADARGVPWVLVLSFTLLRLCGPALLEYALCLAGAASLLTRHLRLRVALWLPAVAALLLYPAVTAGYPLGVVVPELVLCAYLLGAALSLALSYRRAPGTAAPRPAQPYLVTGLAVGLGPPAGLTLVPQVVQGHPLLPAPLTLLALGALPVCSGLALVRVDLFGITVRRRVRRLLERMGGIASVTALAGLVTLLAQEPWRLLLPFLEAGLAAALVFAVHHYRPPGRQGARLARGAMGAGMARGDAGVEHHRVDPPTDAGAAGVESGRHTTVPLLTAREREVLMLAAEGLRTWQIAARLTLSERTVEAYFTRLYTKLEVHTRAAAVRVALEHRLLSAADDRVADALAQSTGQTVPGGGDGAGSTR